MVTKRFGLLVLFGVVFVLMTVGIVYAGPQSSETDLYDVTDKETIQLFEELTEPGQELFLRLWKSLREKAPRYAWEGLVYKIVRQYHVSEYGEDGKGVGEDPVLLRDCTMYLGTAISCGASATHTGSSCTWDSMNAHIEFQGPGGWAANGNCDDCSLAFAYVWNPQECNKYSAIGRHLWKNDGEDGFAGTTYERDMPCCCE